MDIQKYFFSSHTLPFYNVLHYVTWFEVSEPLDKGLISNEENKKNDKCWDITCFPFPQKIKGNCAVLLFNII